MFYNDPFSRVAQILSLISDLPNPRNHPLESDLKGDFHIWFDGGAVRHDTGLSKYCFADGAEALAAASLRLWVKIKLPDDREFIIEERE